MAVYYILMILIAGLAYPLCIRKPTNKKNVIYVSIVFIYMFIMSVFRYGIGNDFFSYRNIFYNYASNPSGLAERFSNRDFEIGYTVLMEIARLLGGDYIILNLLIALIILIPTAIVIIKYSKMPWLSCWLYLTVTFFYNSLNFTRQTIAATIVLLGYHFIKEKKHWAVVLLILAGSLFHMSVLIVLPIYLMSLIKPSVKLYAPLSAAVIAVFIFSDKIIEFAVTKFFPSYSGYLDTVFLTVGLSWVFLIIPFGITALLMTAYFTGWNVKCPEAGILVNFSFYSSIIWLFIVKHFIIERFTLPIYIFIILSIPEVIFYFKDFRISSSKPKGSHFKTQNDSALKKFMSYALKNGKSLHVVLTAVVLIATVTYNDYCIRQGVHGVFPYKSMFNAASQYSDEQIRNEYRKVFPGKNLQEFITMINRGDFTTVITVNGNAGSTLDFSAKTLLKQIGIKTDLNKLDGKSYIGVVSGGKSVYEVSSESVIEEKFAICDNSVFITVISGGTNADQQVGQIMIDDNNYSPDVNGLNIAVFDNKKKKIAAAQAYDTSDYRYTCTNTTAFYGEIIMEE